MKKPYYFFGLLVVCLLIGILYLPGGLSSYTYELKIPPGATVSSIAASLKDKGHIRSETAFKLVVKLFGTEGDFKAGGFTLNNRLSLSGIIYELTHQNGISSYTKVLIPEGFRLAQIAKRLADSGVIEQEQLFLDYIEKQALSDFKDDFDFLKEVPSNQLEGYLYPSTYYISESDTPKSITRQMFEEFEKSIWSEWKKADAALDSPKSRFTFHEVLTLASIIEREAYLKSEQTLISSVYNNRLKSRMPLESCPTVYYALGIDDKPFLTYEDTRVQSPYNTYIHSGFPPSPIASPGKDAFLAALNPKDTDYFYFVANEDHSHSFSKSYAEHVRIQRVQSRRGTRLE